MTSYMTELIVRERMRERLAEAESERLARLAHRPGRDHSWHPALTLAAVRRLMRVAATS